jgi:signal transduction histidine kinase
MVASLYLPAVLLAAIVGMVVAFMAWLRGDRPGARPLSLFLVAASLWAVAEAISVATAGATGFWSQVGLSLSPVIPIAWLTTVLAYTGRERWLTRHRVGLLLVEPAVFVVLVWTNPGHGLVWIQTGIAPVGDYTAHVATYGAAFWGHQAYSYLLVAAGAVVLVGTILRTSRVYRAQSLALLVAIGIPMVGNALGTFGLVSPGVDPTAPGFVVSGVVLAVALFRTDLLRLSPAIRELGREEVLAELDDSVFIIDGHDRIVDANPAARELLGIDPVGQYLDEALPELADAIERDDRTRFRLNLDGAVRYYGVRVSSLYRYRGILSGRLVSLRDVTDQHQREQRLDVLNRVLRHNIRNELNIVRGNVDIAREEANPDVADRLSVALDTLEAIVDRSEKVSTLSRLFELDTGGRFDLAAELESDVDTLREEYPRAELTLSLPAELLVASGPAVVTVFEELLRNAIEHNDTDSPRVTVSVDETASDDRYVAVRVADNGPGIGEQERRAVTEGRETPLEHSSGVGLWLARWITERNGGSLSIENTDDGAVVTVVLPRASGEDGADEGSDRATEADAEQADPVRASGEP